jgi:hypothetical protein
MKIIHKWQPLTAETKIPEPLNELCVLILKRNSTKPIINGVIYDNPYYYIKPDWLINGLSGTNIFVPDLDWNFNQFKYKDLFGTVYNQFSIQQIKPLP